MTRIRSAYVRAALEAELGSLRNTSSGRACAAFRAAAAIGQFVGADAIPHEVAESLLLRAALDTDLSEREARGHIRRGLVCGERTPRALSTNHRYEGSCRSLPHSSLSIEHHPARPPQEEVDALWSASATVGSDREIAEWFCLRYGDRGPSFLEHADAWDLIRAIPRGLRSPGWAWSHRGSWSQSGHRLLFRLWNHVGNAVSVRVRCLDAAAAPKSLAPCGFSVKGLVLADPVAVKLLTGDVALSRETLDVVIAEGEPDWLLWSARPRDAQTQRPACFAVEAGAWCQEIADRIPDGAKIAVRTHLDVPGERYARKILATLKGRCQIFRSRGEEGACK